MSFLREREREMASAIAMRKWAPEKKRRKKEKKKAFFPVAHLQLVKVPGAKGMHKRAVGLYNAIPVGRVALALLIRQS